MEVIPEGVRVEYPLMAAARAGEFDAVVPHGRVEQVAYGVRQLAGLRGHVTRTGPVP